MAQKISFDLHRVQLGYLDFPNERLQAVRSASGIVLTIPTVVHFEFVERLHQQGMSPHFSRLIAYVTINGLEVGIARDEQSYDTWPLQGEGRLDLPLHADVVRRIEGARAGGPVSIRLRVRGELCGIYAADPAYSRRYRGVPLAVHGDVEVTYSRDAWVTMLNVTGMGDNVVVEIPLPVSLQTAATPWEAIWKALTVARDALKNGGETGWKATVMECRHALELWNKNEPPSHGAGWHAPTMPERMQRTKAERIDNLRWDLFQLAHDAAHSPADHFTREDAVLILSALASLVAIRNP